MTQADDQAEDMVQWLTGGGAFGAAPVRRIDTHAAIIFLAGDTAWKMKKPVRFGYLDFSTAERRGQALATELRLNRRSAPRLYLGLRPILRDEAGAFHLGEAEGNAGVPDVDDGTALLMSRQQGETVDWLLEMRRFPDGAVLAERDDLAGMASGFYRDLADHIVALHRDAEVAITGNGAARLQKVIDGNAASMAAFPDSLPVEKAQALTRRLSDEVERQAELLNRRGRDGRIRHVHGDLHLGNIAIIDGKPIAFDCLEFDAELATTDVLYDLAFLLMDLWERGLKEAASTVFNRYMDMSAVDEDALVLMPLLMAVRATIRAHVAAARAGQKGDDAGRDDTGRDDTGRAQAGRYLDFALSLSSSLSPYVSAGQAPPRLIAIGGLSGTGKSTLARLLGGEVAGPPGARIVRSDVLRKRLMGVLPETPLPPSAYTQETSRLVYEEMVRLTRGALAQGCTVITDAVFAQPEERQAMRDAARACGCAFHGLWLYLEEEERVARIDGRHGDASDATADIARAQTKKHRDMPSDWFLLHAGNGGGALVRRAGEALDSM